MDGIEIYARLSDNLSRSKLNGDNGDVGNEISVHSATKLCGML